MANLIFGKQYLPIMSPGFQLRRADWRHLQKLFESSLLHFQVDTFYFFIGFVSNPRKEKEFWMETQFPSQPLAPSYFATRKIVFFRIFFFLPPSNEKRDVGALLPPISHQNIPPLSSWL